ncbi:MAG: right-handed parallel beta-helix repeat-containing protein [Reyranella sp.]|nr:right-handed parallel beta-helix repeat-containing protein [Reyranella sp.]MBL6650163.1 right-handed parallel beta-helix repeat-containing protein [Reyranella sp.]
MTASDAPRRGLLGIAAGTALVALPALAAAQQKPRPPTADGHQMLSAASFGARGDGATDDTAALQSALDAAFAPGGPGFLAIPPGTYKVSRTLRVATPAGEKGDITRQHGLIANGAHLVSSIEGGGNVFEFISNATVRFLLIEGLDILGGGREGHGIYLECEHKEHYLYNICLREVTVQGCGGDGCRMMGNVFESQVINSYLRDNKKNGMTLGHGARAGILSAIHVFGCVFGQNGQYGVEMVNGCYDAGFHGCYFLLNGKHGLVALNGCTLLSNCGFENNHESAPSFDKGGAGIYLQNFGTLIGCTAYSMFKQKRLIDAYVVSKLVMIGSDGHGDAQAKDAGLARIDGEKKRARVTIIGSAGTIEYANGFEALEIGGGTAGVRFGSDWQSPNLAQLGIYRLWVDKRGRLRLKNGPPTSDEDGSVVGA